MDQSRIRDYLLSLSKDAEGRLGRLRKEAEASDVPIIKPDTEELLRTMVQLLKPESILEIGTAIGVSVTVNPYDHIKVSGHFRVIPSYSMLYAAEDFSSSYGTFFSAGGAIAWKAISLGIEGRWGKAKYNSVFNVDDMEEMEDAGDILEGNYDGSSKWKTGSVRFYISFRY